MKSHKIHRVIVEDPKTKNFTGFITYETIFEFFVNNYYGEMNILQLKTNDLNIFTRDVVYIDKNETIYNSLLKFWEHKVSILPVYDSEKKQLFGFFYLKDIVYFFANGEKFTVKFCFKS